LSLGTSPVTKELEPSDHLVYPLAVVATKADHVIHSRHADFLVKRGEAPLQAMEKILHGPVEGAIDISAASDLDRREGSCHLPSGALETENDRRNLL
jgi:hypothetical protein